MDAKHDIHQGNLMLHPQNSDEKTFKFPEFIGFQPFKGYFSKLRNIFPQILLGCETSKRSSMDDLLGNFSGCEMSMIYE